MPAEKCPAAHVGEATVLMRLMRGERDPREPADERGGQGNTRFPRVIWYPRKTEIEPRMRVKSNSPGLEQFGAMAGLYHSK